MQNPPWQPLFSVQRSFKTEVTVYGLLTVVNYNFSQNLSNVLFSVGDPKTSLWTRSLLKSCQLMGIYDVLTSHYPMLKEEHLALMMASHSANDVHLRLIDEILALTKLSPDSLKCPQVTPKDNKNTMASPIYHNCSGKHLGHLLAAQALNLNGYLDPNLPLYDNLKEILKGLSPDFDDNNTIDGCNLPNYALSAFDIASWYMYLASFGKVIKPSMAQYKPLVTRIAYLMKQYPFIIGGSGRLDSSLMAGSQLDGCKTEVIAKEGADGLLAIGLEFNHTNLGILIKLASGFNKQYMEMILDRVLKRLDYGKILALNYTENNLSHINTQFYF